MVVVECIRSFLVFSLGAGSDPDHVIFYFLPSSASVFLFVNSKGTAERASKKELQLGFKPEPNEKTKKLHMHSTPQPPPHDTSQYSLDVYIHLK